MSKKKDEKKFRIIIEREDYIKVLNLCAFDDTGIHAIVFRGKKAEIRCYDPRAVYEKAIKILKEHDIKFLVEE